MLFPVGGSAEPYCRSFVTLITVRISTATPWLRPGRSWTLRGALLVSMIMAVVAGTLTGAGHAAAGSTAPARPTALAQPAAAVPAGTSRLITVAAHAAGSSYATLSAWALGAGGRWTRVLGPVPARVGDAGIGAAREGSTLTPRGRFPLTVAFGRQPNPGTAMPFFRTDPLDWWDENPASPTYNLHVRQTKSPGGASENLYYSGTAYDYAVNIASNPARVPGAGSAIFLHVNTGQATAGCVSIAAAHLVTLLRWLNPAARPMIDIRVGAELVPTPTLSAAQAGRVVTGLYRGVLRRSPDPAGAAAFASRLRSGASPAAAAATMANSRENLARVVTAGYRACLNRRPDPGGLAANANRLAAGGSWSATVGAMCASTEAWIRSGRTAAGWIAALYRGVLGRAPDIAAVRYWSAALARSGRLAVATGIASSRESSIRQLDDIYRAMLGRPIDPSGLAARLLGMPGRGVFTVPVAVAGSTEFFDHTQR